MLVKIDRRMVDVSDRECATRACFRLGFDKGSFSQGRGYTSYHTDAKGRRVEKPVCMTRHLHGCPANSVCSTCRTVSVRAPGGRCDRWQSAMAPDRLGVVRQDCGGRLIAREEPPDSCLDCLRDPCRCALDEAGDLEAQLDMLTDP